jgi:hypothetical protein
MSMKRVVVSLSFASALALPAVASAQEPKKDCEPGSWFCGESAPPAGQGGKPLESLPPTEPPAEEPAPPPGGRPAPRAYPGAPPPVVVYQPPPPTVVIQSREAPPPYYYVPKRGQPRKEWGLNLHVGGIMMGGGRQNNAGMGEAGLGLRFRPIPQAALEANLDFAAGRDYNGYRRNETAFTLNGLIFLNPKNVTQVYLLGGFGWSGANAIDDTQGFDKTEYKYGYFGVQGGIGLEFRLSRVVALNFDLRGIVRTRIDSDKDVHPEFVSADGKSTNTSGAGVLTGGITFYW